MSEKLNRVIRKPELVETVGLSHVTLWRLEKAGKFPKRLQLGGRAVGWLESDVQAWIESKAVVNG